MDTTAAVDHGEFLHDTFPKDFIWGMGTASYQCEGGWDADGKGMSIWDTFVREQKHKIADGTNGDVALDSYNHYKQDVQMLKAIGAKVYRFSLSWARILPSGRMNKINQPGIDYYNSLINELLANGIQPMITLYHWDLPQGLEDTGGWLNREIVDVFAQYARLCFEKFGDRVKYWTTLNEPFISGMMGYTLACFAPGIENVSADAPYTYVHNQLMAHAEAYRIYEREFKAKYGGIVGLSADTSCYLPYDANCPDDIEAAERAFRFRLGWVLEPLYTGNYPKVMRELIDKRSKEQGRKSSRLPEFDEAWSKKLKGSVDFIGINFYNAELCKARDDDTHPRPKGEHWDKTFKNPFFCPDIPGWNDDCHVYRCHNPKWPPCGAPWQDFAPSGIRGCLNWVAKTYGNPTMMVTETGCSSVDDRLNDEQRKEFFKYSINAVLKAIKEDKCNVVGYVGWSLLDVYEWVSGHTIGFGIVQTDKSTPDMKRTLKDSAKYLATVFRNNGFPEDAKT